MNTTTQKTDYNSNINQNIKGRFIGQHVNLCLSSLIPELSTYQNGEFWEELENGYSRFESSEKGLTKCPNCMEENLEVDCETGLCEDCFESEPQDILEWWSVSSYMYDKLKEMGYPVWNNGMIYVWGRCTSGQAILLDAVISYICEGMEILDGQINSWGIK